MIVYSSTKKEFINDVLGGCVDTKILDLYVRETGNSISTQEQEAQRNSMQYMKNVMDDSEIPDNAGVAIEYKIPQTSKRIDFILTGKGADNRPTAIVIELKQWSKGISVSEKDGIVNADFYGGRETNHPSYQAWSYTTLLQDYNSSIEEKNIELVPCAFLHNYEEDGIVKNEFYKEYTDKAPVFFKRDLQKLQTFIKKYVKFGDNKDTLFEIENGKIRPSKSLADSLKSMLKGNKEFTLIDDQKIVYETALDLGRKSTVNHKNVLIIEGGPGTGKSVVAINLLVKFTNLRKTTFYVTRNSAPRAVYQSLLSGDFTRSRITSLFSPSGSFIDTEPNTFHALIVDEAHRLSEKSGWLDSKGENQVKELINAAKFTVFFIDENQRVTLKDIGRKTEIVKWANELGVTVHSLELASQFRCNGSNGYLAWLDNILQIKETANDIFDIDYDFQVIDNPGLIHEEIKEKNKEDNKSRMLAGYCWKWISKKQSNLKDIAIGNYQATWNLSSQGQSWIIHPDSVSEVGCIHTSQGLELNYVGVIIGPDLIVRNGRIITDASKRASSDKSLQGYKKLFQDDPKKAIGAADIIIKNTYRTLMTRGMKGCYIYCTDPETQEYFKEHLSLTGKENTKYSNIPDGISINTDE